VPKLRISPRASSDLIEIWSYIADDIRKITAFRVRESVEKDGKWKT
jgi:plasmid stabilization system protein ParE